MRIRWQAMRCVLPWPSEYCHPQAPDTSSSPLFNLHLNPNWVNRPTDQQSTQDMPKIPLRPLRCSAQTPSAPAQRSREGPQIPASWWTWRRKGDLEHFATVQPYQRGSLSALDFRFLPLLFRANQGPWNCALWLYSFSFESCRPDTRIGDNNNCSTSKWLCNTSHLRIIRIRILEKWAKYKHHPSFKAGHSFFLCYFARFFFTPGTFSQDFVSLMLFTPLPLH